jgi:hypothetical protein
LLHVRAFLRVLAVGWAATTPTWWVASTGSRPAALEHLVIANRGMGDSQFHDPVEQPSTTSRGSPVEAKNKLIEMAGQVRAMNG